MVFPMRMIRVFPMRMIRDLFPAVLEDIAPIRESSVDKSAAVVLMAIDNAID